MEREEIIKRLEPIFRDVFDDENIVLSEDTKPEDIEDWDSIGHVYLLVEIEDEFGITIGERMAQIENVREMIDIMLTLM